VRLPAALRPLEHRQFRLLWAGQAISAVGDGLVSVALAFAVLRIGGSASQLGLVLAASLISRVAFFLVGGVWADRLPRQLVMLASDLIRAAQQLVIGVLLITGGARIWHLVVGAVVFGAATAFFLPATTGLVPETVPASGLQQANALMGLSRSATSVVGPALSGVLTALFGPGWVFVINALTFLVSTLSLARLRVPRRLMPARESFLRELAGGWHEFAIRPWYWLNLCSHALWAFGIAAFFVLGPVIASRQLGGPSSWGVIAASLGVGSILGGLVALRFKPSRPLVVANLALTLAALMLLALVPPFPVLVIAVSCVAGYSGLTFLNEVWEATMQQLIPADVMSRVTAYDMMISSIAMPAGYAVAGPAAAHFGIRPTLVIAAGILAVPSLVVVAIPGVRRVRRMADGTIAEGAFAHQAG
jgi:MFS family permease